MEMSVIKIRQYKLLYKTIFLSKGLLLTAWTHSKDYLINFVAVLTADHWKILLSACFHVANFVWGSVGCQLSLPLALLIEYLTKLNLFSAMKIIASKVCFVNIAVGNVLHYLNTSRDGLNFICKKVKLLFLFLFHIVAACRSPILRSL